MSNYQEILQTYWGYPSFRSLQEEIVSSIGSGKDTLAILPTGGGKSICFQVPALAQDGLCLVISPLVALMQDQVEQLRMRRIRTEMVVSGMSLRKIDYAYNNCSVGNYKFLYVSPERLQNEDFLGRVKEMPISMIAIDEAHCISQWGYDFRPSYLEIKQLREIHDVPMIALTATATPEVQKDIIEKLELRDPNCFVGSLARSNLSFQVREVPDKLPKVREILKYIHGQLIIYTMSRRKTKMIADYLKEQRISSTYYHAGLTKEQRNKRQKLWIEGKVRVMVATNAFGMGIDKGDVRSVIHFELPESMEAYYQEAGRAGRDNKNAVAVLLWNNKDKERLQYSKENQFPEIKVLKSILIGLWSYFQISFGKGPGKPHPFSIFQFAKRYNLEIKLVYQALQALSREGLIALTEPFYSPSTIQFLITNEELYRYQVKHEAYEPVIKFILRNYPGVFDQPTKISEQQIATHTSNELEVVKKQLKYLHQSRIVNYYGQSEFPLLLFLEPRPMHDEVSMNRQQISFLRNRHHVRLDAMNDFTNTSTCRMLFIQQYFGEKNEKSCGICDKCLAEKTKKAKANQQQLQQDILSLLAKEKKTTDELTLLTNAKRAHLEEVLFYLKKEEKISQNHEWWVRNESSAQ